MYLTPRTANSNRWMPSQPIASWTTPCNSRSDTDSGTRTRRQIIGLIPSSRTLSCGIASGGAAGFTDSMTENYALLGGSIKIDPNRGRDAGYPAPPAQIRAGALTHTAPASGQTSAALSATCRLARLRGPQAACVTRTRHSVRYVLWPVDLPLAPVLRSIDSAGTLIPLFADFTATMTESDSSSPFVSGYDSSVFPSRPRH